MGAGFGAGNGVGSGSGVGDGSSAGASGKGIRKYKNVNPSRHLEEDEFGVTLYTNLGSSTWFSSDYMFPTYDIQDLDGNVLYLEGTLCAGDRRLGLVVPPNPPAGKGDANGGGGGGGGGEGEEEKCEFALGPGVYKYRVTGALYTYKQEISWEFCHTEGYAQQELLFKVVAQCDRRRAAVVPPPVPAVGAGAGAGGGDGAGAGGGGGEGDEDCDDYVCVPLELRTVTTVCTMLAEEIESNTEDYTLSGSIHIGGAQTAELTSRETTVLKSALAQEFSDASSGAAVLEEDVNIISWDVFGTGSGSRGLSNGLAKLSFEVKVNAQQLGSSSADLATQHLKAYMRRSMSSGLFVAKLVSKASLMEQKSLQSVNFAELLDLNVLHKTIVNEGMSGLASVVVSLGALFGIAFGFVMYRSFSSKKQSYAVLSSTPKDDVPLPDSLYSMDKIHGSIPSSGARVEI